jgi:hypothetical protein
MPISDSLFARSEVRAMRALRKEFIMLRRKRIVTACAALLFAVTGHSQDTSIRPFMVNVPEEAFVDLRRRLAATRWPSRETVAVAQTAMLAGLPYTALCDAILAHPTMVEGLGSLFSNVPLRSGQ